MSERKAIDYLMNVDCGNSFDEVRGNISVNAAAAALKIPAEKLAWKIMEKKHKAALTEPKEK